jgi:arylsulfatase
MIPRLFLLLCLLVGCSDDIPMIAQAIPEYPARQPVILILIDTLRADHTSLHGYHRDTTPFLSQLALESIVFGRAYAPASWTRASIASLLTARIPEAHGCEDRDGHLAASMTTLTEVFKENGYATRGVTANGNVTERFGFAQGFDEYIFVKDFPAHPYATAEKMKAPVRTALAELDQGDEPFFVYLHYVDPHDPYVAHEDTDFSPNYEGPMDGTRDALKPFTGREPPPEEKQRAIDLYDGEILWFDQRLRELFEDLEQSDRLDSAWIVITSDHGEGLWSHRVQGHGQEITEEQIRVPLIVRPPGGLDGHIWIDDPISLIDVAPTILDLVGIERPVEFDGRSWAPFLRGTAPAPVRPVILDEELDMFLFGGVIDGDDKLIIDYKRGTKRLYDLSTNPGEDPAQATNVDGVFSLTGRRLEQLLDEELRAAGQKRPTDIQGSAEEDPELLEILRAMGYLGDDSDEGSDAGADNDSASGSPEDATNESEDDG